MANGGPTRRTSDPASPTIVGYANALLRLGRRYERHLGFERNVSEAVRCYLKAARLGNSEALARLAPGPAAADTVMPDPSPVTAGRAGWRR